MKSYHNVTQTLLFMVYCIAFSLLVSYALSRAAELIWEYHVGMINVFMAISLYFGTRLYPYKKFDSKGHIQGMHRGALVVAAMYIFGMWPRFYPSRVLSESGNAAEWLSSVGLISLLIALFAYWLMDLSLRQSGSGGAKNVAEQVAASDR